MTTIDERAKHSASHRATVSSRLRGERRLGTWLTLPSYVVMLLVTAYPWCTHCSCRCTTIG